MGANPNVIKDNQDAVNRMQKFIADHLREPITQFQLSRAAGYSEYYAAKIFKEFTGRTPFEYIRLLRLAEASKKLSDGKSKVVDVAFDYVFDSHEGFTRAFAKEFGITPKRFSKHPIAINLFTPYEPDHSHPPNFNRKEEESMNEVTPVVFAQIMERPARKVLLKRVKTAENYFQFCEELGCDEAGAVWNVLCGIPNALYEPIGMWMPASLRPQGTSVYTQGVEVPLDWQGEIPSSFEAMELPACKMLVFQGPPYDDEKYCEAIDLLWRQIANFNPRIYGYEWADEVAPKFQLAPMGYRGYIEGRPVKELNRVSGHV